MNTMIALLAAAIVAVSPSAPALAQPATVVRVATHDLNLATVQGQQALKRRIARAASEVCGGINDRFGTGVRIAQRQCRDDATAAALAAAHIPDRLAGR